MVPSCRMPQSQRKLDKSTILKLTVSYMKLHADLLPDTLDESTMSWKPSFMSNEELGQLMLEALDGFLFVIWSTGRTIYVSESITPLLGHLQQELLGKNFLELVHPEDMAMVQERMFPAQTESGYIEEIGTPSPQPVNSPSSTSSDTPSFLRRNFVTRMRRGGFSSKAEYEMVSCSGHLRRWNEVTRNSPVETVEMLPLDGYCLVGVGRLQCNQTIREMTPSVPTLNEWTSYHSPDAKFIHVDQNASAILGYTAAELLGSSGYNFYHDEDLNALARSHVDLTKSGTGDTSLYRFLTKGQQWLWVKTRGLIKYNEGTKQPSAIVCRNIVVSYAEVWQYLQNKARQYGPEERKMITPATPPDGLNTAAAAPTTKMETTSPGSEVKVEQFSPQSAHYLDPNSHPNFYQTPETPPRKPFGFSPESSAAPAPNPGVAPVAAPYYNPTAPTPNFIAFTTTEYVQPNTQRTTTSNTFNDLFPGYKPSISTEETHGRYRAPARFNPPPTPGCQFQKSENSFNRSYPEDVKPVYIQQTTQQQPQQPGQFLQTISSPPSAPANGLRGVPNRPATSVLLTTVNSAPPPNQVISTPSTFHHPSSTRNVMVTASQTPNVMVTTPANVIVMGQPGYVNNYIGPAAVATHHQVPNVTLRSVPVHTEEPVVGMPVSTGFTEPQQVTSLPVSTTYNQQAPSLLLGNNNNIGMEGMRQQQQQQQQQHQQPQQQQQQQHVTSPRKGVSVYSCGSEKRCPSPGNLNSCAQASMKRMRNDGPVSQCIPAYIKPTVQLPTHIPYSNGQYTTTTTPYFSPHTNGYHHQLSSEIKQTGHVIGVPDTHSATVYHSIDTGQHLQKQT